MFRPLQHLPRRLRHTSLALQLSVAVTLGVVLVVLLSALAYSLQSRNRMNEVLRSQGEHIAESLAQGSQLALAFHNGHHADGALQSAMAFPGVAAASLHDNSGTQLTGRSTLQLPDVATRPAGRESGAQVLHEDSQYWHFVAPVIIAANTASPFETGVAASQIIGHVRVVQSKATLSLIAGQMATLTFALALVFALLFVLVVRNLAARLTRPLHTLAGIMDQAQHGDTRLQAGELSGPRDMVALAQAFNRMIDALSGREQRFRSLAALASDWYWEQDQTGRFTYISAGFKEITGLDPSRVLGEKRGSQSEFTYVPAHWEYYQQCIASRTPFHDLEWEVRQPDGDVRHGISSGEPVHDSSGQFLGYRGIGKDDTEKKRSQQHLEQLNRQLGQRLQERTFELQEARLAAESAHRSKSVFLANMSHEIRTPLNAVLGYAQLLARDPLLPAALLSTLTPIEKAGHHLLGLINDILDLAKIEAGAMALDIHDFDLAALVQELATLFIQRCQQKGLQWRLLHNLATPCPVLGDPAKIRQVLINLLGNAVKFTDRGQVMLRITCIEPDDYHFEVIDSGPGIAPAEQETLFQPFRQLDAGSKKGGTGLGLAIAARHVELMGSSLQLDSAPSAPGSTSSGQTGGDHAGARFYFSLQLAVARQQGNQIEPLLQIDRMLAAHPCHILVVDDQHDNRQILSRMLHNLGIEVTQAGDGIEALALMAREHFDLVFLDIHMPGLDGPATLRRLHSESPGPHPPCVAVTASVLQPRREVWQAQGFDDFIAKPFLFGTICSCLQRLLAVQFTYRPSVPGAGNADSAPQAPLVIAQATWQAIMSALDSGWVSGIARTLPLLAQEGGAAELLAARLQALLDQYDMDGIRQAMQGVKYE